MNLNLWAIQWGVPFEAVEDLRRQMGAINTDPDVEDGESEAATSTRVRLEATRAGGRLFRNNVGGGHVEGGSYVRWGLANDSARLNKIIKSSDLIGIMPVTITPEHVGQTLGQFTAREMKPEAWRYAATPREVAQLRFIALIISLGGNASFSTGEGTL